MSRYTDAEKAEILARARAKLEELNNMQPYEPSGALEAEPWPTWESGNDRDDRTRI
jgi:hypothetical protein